MISSPPRHLGALAFLLSALLSLAGCASTDEDDAALEPLRFAAIAAPAIGEAEDEAEGDEGAILLGEEELTREDLVLELATRLSGSAGKLDLFLVPGPLLRAPSRDYHASIVGALGSVAAPVIVGLAPTDGPLDELLEALGSGLDGHEGLAAQWGVSKSGWRAHSLGPDGAWPVAPVQPRPEAEDEGSPGDEDESGDARPDKLLIVHAQVPVEAKEARFQVVTGAVAALERVDKRVVLTLPPLHQAPYLYALGRIEGGKVHVTLFALQPGVTPPLLAPVELWAASAP